MSSKSKRSREPKTKGSEVKKQRKHHEVLALVEALNDPTDRYGAKHKEKLTQGIVPCFCCLAQLSTKSIYCYDCVAYLNFCKKCSSSAPEVIGRGVCVFCERKRTDNAKELISKIEFASLPAHLQDFLKKLSE